MRLRDAYAHCREITRRAKSSFAIAFATLPAGRQAGLHAIYAFCRTADDIADGQGVDKRSALTRLRDGLRRSLSGRAEDALFTALAHTVGEYGIPRQYFDEIIDGVLYDLQHVRFADFNELRRYCYGVASAVGLACLYVFGFRSDQAHQAAEDLGIAMQLTNIIRDVGEDAARGRVYLPADDLKRFGVAEADITARRVTREFVDLMHFEIARAREFFSKGERLVPMVARLSRPCPAVIAAVYKALLDRIERHAGEVLARRITLPSPMKIRVATVAAARALV
jgi:phytoene synthase